MEFGKKQLRPRRRRGLVFLATLCVIEIALRASLGNYANSSLRETEGGCALRSGAVVYTGWLLRVPGVRTTVNVQGFRGEAQPLEKPPQTFRILVVGDSFAFGQGLADDRTIPVQLEQALGASAAESVEVLNFGIEGLNVEEVRDQYADFASRWEHDLTLYLLSPNDGGPPGCNAPSALFTVYRNVYVLRVPLAVLVLAISPFSAKPDPAIVESRLIDGVRRLAAANRAHAARLGVVLLGVPMGISDSWAKRVGVPILDVSRVLSRDENRIAREGHYNERGAAQVVAAIDDWLRRDPRWKSLALQRAPGPDSMR